MLYWALFWALSAAAAPSTLGLVRARGALNCGVVTQAQDWDKEDLHGDLSPLTAEICRAVAIAVLGRAEAVRLHPFPAEAPALGALRAADIDLLVGVTPSATRSLQYGITFGPPIFWDTQTLLANDRLGIAGLAGLGGRTVCYIDGTDEGGVLLAAMHARSIAIRPFPFQEEGEMEAGLAGGHCAAVTASSSRLAAMRSRLLALAHGLVMLPEVLAVFPACIATRAGDAAWSATSAAVIDALVESEMLGIGQADVSSARPVDDPVARHLLGTDWSAGQSLGLAHDWSAQMLRAVGNYGEIFDRTLGAGSPLGLKRGLNAVCLHGGAMCAPQVR